MFLSQIDFSSGAAWILLQGKRHRLKQPYRGFFEVFKKARTVRHQDWTNVICWDPNLALARLRNTTEYFEDGDSSSVAYQRHIQWTSRTSSRSVLECGVSVMLVPHCCQCHTSSSSGTVRIYPRHAYLHRHGRAARDGHSRLQLGFRESDHGQGNVDERARISTPVKQCSENTTGSLVNMMPSDGAIRNGTRLRAITAPGVAPEPKSKLNKFTNVLVDLRNNATTDESAVKAAALNIRGYVSQRS